MANNFKIIGDSYISKSGHDSNDGLTPDTPVKDWKNTLSGLTIFGAGEYNRNVAMYSNSVNLRAQADGKVILRTLTNSPLISGEMGFTFTGIEFIGFNGVTYSSHTTAVTFINCTLKDWTRLSYMASGFTRYPVIRGCKILNCNGHFNDLNTTDFYLEDSIIINTVLYPDSININSSGAFRLKNNYMDKDSSINLSFSNPGYFRNNNINGIIILGGINYAIQDQFTGTPQDNGYGVGVQWLNEANLTANGYANTIVGWNTAVATCINRDPLFNNVAFEDFSLQAGSPHIGASTSGLNIGNTEVAISIYNTGNSVTPSAEINSSNPNSFTVGAGFDEGYIDYIEKIGSTSLTLGKIDPISSLEFNSDIAGGTTGNKNVPDSEPLSFEYPRKLTTTSLAADTLTLNVTGHDAVVGEFVRYAGQDREITAITADTITVASAFRAAVGDAQVFQIGAKIRIGALNPNRITFMMRTSKEADRPTLDSQWDNDIDPVYNKAGTFLTQEWGQVPGYYIDTLTNDVWGSGDSETPSGLSKNEISCRWVHVRVYIRNNYQS